jgi:hypothetical protein
LLVIAVLLPIRGAMAAALPCLNLGHGATVAEGHHGHHHHGMGLDGEHHDDASSRDAAGHHDDHGGVDKCNVCASCCTAPPMMATFSPAIAPLDMPAVPYPVLTASAPSFVSEGQERPPRSI